MTENITLRPTGPALPRWPVSPLCPWGPSGPRTPVGPCCPYDTRAQMKYRGVDTSCLPISQCVELFVVVGGVFKTKNRISSSMLFERHLNHTRLHARRSRISRRATETQGTLETNTNRKQGDLISFFKCDLSGTVINHSDKNENPSVKACLCYQLPQCIRFSSL